MLKLDANEGVCLLSKDQRAAILSPEVCRRYPDSEKLEGEIAHMMGLPARNVLATAGADDAIDRAFRAFAGSEQSVATTSPGFVEFLDASKRTGAAFLSVRRRATEAFPVRGLCTLIEDRKPSLTVLASPDNPFGTMLAEEDFLAIADVCARNGSLFLFDATYLDFADPNNLLPLALEQKNIIVTGSFSKSRGLAGFRVGWAAVGEKARALLPAMREAGPPFSLSAPAIEAASLMLRENAPHYAAYVSRIREERSALREAVAAIGLETWPSQANFVTATAADARKFAAGLKEKGVAIRCWPANSDAADLVRITCPGEAESFRILLKALEASNGGTK